MPPNEKYEAVIGLEVHAQLLTKSKVFCSDSTEFGAPPNTQVSPVSLGHPGTLPLLNEKVVEFAVMLGLACHCDITKINRFERKNYFYPDLPKGYQISQFTTPICTGGFLEIKAAGQARKIQLNRIHIEEDAGKSIHDQDHLFTLIDLNRAGVPLLEIVTEPDLHTAEEAYQYLTELRKLVRYLNICDGNMEEGSLRCDANISIRLKGTAKLGVKVEVKNLNSIRNVKNAIEFEIKRQIEVAETGGQIMQSTRSYDASNGTTFSLRSKERAHDYRYFPEPDLPPFEVTAEYIKEIKTKMPALPDALKQKLVKVYGLPEYDADVLTSEKSLALYFEEIARNTQDYKGAANWMMGAIKSFLNERSLDIADFEVKPETIASLINLVNNNTISNSAATQRLFPELIKHPDSDPERLAQELNLIQKSDVGVINNYIEAAINKYPEKVKEYKNGKKGLIGLFMGEVMKQSKGQVDPKLANKLLVETLNKN